MFTNRSRVGDRVTLTRACAAEVVVPTIIRLPRHHVVRILTAARAVAGSVTRADAGPSFDGVSGARRIYTDVHQA
jgi:hypothetical protein